jgi:hypothetical protein
MGVWYDQVVIYEGEDREALVSDFVRLSSIYHDRPAHEIAQQVFRGLYEGHARASQAALSWGNDLDIRDRIRNARRTAHVGSILPSKQERMAELIEIARDPMTMAKDRIAAYKLYSELEGELSKEATKPVVEPRRPVFFNNGLDDGS